MGEEKLNIEDIKIPHPEEVFLAIKEKYDDNMKETTEKRKDRIAFRMKRIIDGLMEEGLYICIRSIHFGDERDNETLLIAKHFKDMGYNIHFEGSSIIISII